MPPSAFDLAVQWIVAHGYVLMFLAMCIEGPTITIAAAFASALGYFDPLAVFVLAILGDIVPDIVLYTIGYICRIHIVERFAHKLGLMNDRIRRMENLLHTNTGKVMLMAKFAPVVSGIGLMIIGALRLPFWRYIGLCLLISLPKCVLLMIVGYEFGSAYYALSAHIQGPALLAISVIVLALLIFVYHIGIKRISNRFAEL